ncbi:MAG TPA: oxygenase MpaB family protein [Mycobacteriales bacterium]|nr:oxygenase MpaB family protein [Mycobacteriales bacterium]
MSRLWVMTSAEQLGYFGPDSLTWRVHADPTLWVGGIRALYLQALHPGAMAGVSRHSGFRTDPWGRLFRTAEYVGTITFGTRSAAERAAGRVRGLHHRLGIDDPDLLRWVHCCEIDSFLTVARRAGLRLTGADADRYVAEQVRAAELVGIPAADAPASEAELRAQIGSYRPALAGGPQAREAARFVLMPPMPAGALAALAARPAWAGVAGLAFCLLPGWARRMYRLPGLPSTDLAASVAVRGLRAALLALPPRLREGPQYQQATRRLAAAGSAPAGSTPVGSPPQTPASPASPVSPNGSARRAPA